MGYLESSQIRLPEKNQEFSEPRGRLMNWTIVEQFGRKGAGGERKIQRMTKMMTRLSGLVVIGAIFAIISATPERARAQVISTPPGEGPYHGPFERGMSSTMSCGKDPETWVRGSGSLDKATGKISETIQLETNSSKAGPTGVVTLTIKDADGKVLATATSNEVGMRGKRTSRAEYHKFSGTASMPVAAAQKAASIEAAARCTGSTEHFVGVDPGAIIHTITVK